MPGGDARQRGTIIGSRIEDEDAGRPGRGRVEIVGSAVAPQGGQGGQHRRCVLADVVATGIHEVPIPQPEPVRDRSRSPAPLGERDRPDRVRRSRRERDHPDAVAAQAQQAPCGSRDVVTRRRAPPRHRAADAHGAAGRSATPSRAGTSAAAPTARDRAASRRSAAPSAIGSPPPAVWYTAPAAPPSSARHAAPIDAPAQQERVDRQRGRAQQTDRRQQPPPDDLEVAEPGGRVVLVAGQQECERFARQRVRIERPEQPFEVGRGARCARRLLQRAHVHHDAHPRGSGHVGWREPRQRLRRSSSRSWTTTTRASTTIRRDILLWPTRRSRKVIGISRTRAPSAAGPECHLDLEDVAAGMDAVEWDGPERARRATP